MTQRTSAALLVALLALGTAAGTARAACHMEPIGPFPVNISGMRALVTARINGTDKIFIIDTGAFFSIISKQAAAELHLPVDAPAGVTMGVGGNATYQIARVKDFRIFGVALHNLQFTTWGTDFENGYAGVIGQNFLRIIGDPEYDFANSTLRFWRTSGCSRDQMAYWVKAGEAYSRVSIQSTTQMEPATQFQAYVNGAPVRVLLDSGTPVSVLSLRAAARAGVKPGDPDVKSAGYFTGGGRRVVETWIAPFASFKVGEEEIRTTHLRIGNLGFDSGPMSYGGQSVPLSAINAGDQLDMLLGFDFFLSHRVFVSNTEHELFFSYNGGPVFNLSLQPPTAGAQGASGTASQAAGAAALPGSATEQAGTAEPVNAAGFARRASLLLAQKDYPHAIADLTRAIEREPAQPQFWHDRAEAYRASQQPQLASADLDHFLQLQPRDVTGLLERAQLHMDSHEQPAAVADLEAASQAASKQDDSRLQMGQLYQHADLYGPAIEQYDLWLTSHDQDARWPMGLFLRCRARALAGQDLDKALSDCNISMSSFSGAARSSALETRGLVNLRRGDLAKSIDDYSEALKLDRTDAWALYGRGLAKLRSGATAAGHADMAAARKVQPDIEEKFKSIGLTP